MFGLEYVSKKNFVVESLDEHYLIQGDSSGLPCLKAESLSCGLFKRGHPSYAWICFSSR